MDYKNLALFGLAVVGAITVFNVVKKKVKYSSDDCDCTEGDMGVAKCCEYLLLIFCIKFCMQLLWVLLLSKKNGKRV